MKKEIFDSLARLSPELSASNVTPAAPLALEISGDLAHCMSALMHTVGKELNLSPQLVLEKILDTGIDSWVGQLPERTRKSIGLLKESPLSTAAHYDDLDDDDPDPAHAQQAAYAQLTESYGYTPLTAHAVSKSGNGRGGDQRGGTQGRKNQKQKKVRNIGKKHPPKKTNSHRRKFSSNKPQAQAQ